MIITAEQAYDGCFAAGYQMNVIESEEEQEFIINHEFWNWY